VRTYVYQSVTLTSYTSGERESKSASSPFGPVKAGLITTLVRETAREKSLVQLTELLNYLEREATILENKSLKVLSTFQEDTTHLVEPNLSTIETTGTK
jgi:hypothetical protein